jgi:hypothetical protein
MIKVFWKDYTAFMQQLIEKGYVVQGFGDLNLIAHERLDAADRHMSYQNRQILKPGCSGEEIKLIRGFFAKTQLTDYFRRDNPGTTAYTYFRTPGDREKGNGLRLDYVYGTMAPWGKVNVLVREDVPGVDHLPLYAYHTDGQQGSPIREPVENRSCSAMLTELNPYHIGTTEQARLGNVLRTIDKQRAADASEHTQESNRCLKIRKIYTLTEADSPAPTTPYLDFFINDSNKSYLGIPDTGADENIISKQEAMKMLGNDYKLHDEESPLELGSAWGDTLESLGCIYLPMIIRYEENGETRRLSDTVRFWVFDGQDIPTLIGIPAMKQLQFGILPVDGVLKVCITANGNMILRDLPDASAGSKARMLTKVEEEIPLSVEDDLELHPGRSIIRVSVGNTQVYDGRTIMSTSHMLGLDAFGTGYIVENNTSRIDNGHAWVSVTVPNTTDRVIIQKGTLLNRGILLPDRCTDAGVTLKGDLVARRAGQGSKLGKQHLGTGDIFQRAVIPEVRLTSSTKTKETKDNENDVDSFFKESKWAKFCEGGLKMFRPTKKERKRIDDIIAHDKEGKRINTFEELCNNIINAHDKYKAVHEKDTPLPTASTEAEVTIKEGSKRVTAGLAQNDMSPAAERLVQTETDKLVKVNAAEPCTIEDIEYCSRIMLVPKPNGEWRFCVDLRGLNKNVELEHWPLTKVDIRLQGMAGAQFFTTLDLPQAFHNIPLAETSRKYFGFKAPNGLYRYKTLPMGYVNSMALFTRLMDMAMIGLSDMVSIYVDDIIVFSKSWQQHMLDLETVFQRLHKAGLAK